MKGRIIFFWTIAALGFILIGYNLKSLMPTTSHNVPREPIAFPSIPPAVTISRAKPSADMPSHEQSTPGERETPPVAREEDQFIGYWKSPVPVSQREDGNFWFQCVIIEKNGSALLVTLEQWQKGFTSIEHSFPNDITTVMPTRVYTRSNVVGTINNGVLSAGKGSFIIDQNTHQLRLIEGNISFIKAPREKSPPLIR